MRTLGMTFLCALLFVTPQVSRTEVPSPQQSAPRNQRYNVTGTDDIDFMLRFEQAIRENDKNWIAQNTRIEFGIIVDGELREFKSKTSIIRHFDEIYPPWVKTAIMTAELDDIRNPNNDLLMVFGGGPTTVLITVYSYCYPKSPCDRETYVINSITTYTKSYRPEKKHR